MLNEKSDAELIELYTQHSDQNAIRVLIERHHQSQYNRFLGNTGNHADAADLSQKLWLQVHKNIHTYKDEGKFPNFLSTVASNLMRDHGRKSGNRAKVIDEYYGKAKPKHDEQGDDYNDDPLERLPDQQQISPDEQADNYRLIDHLMDKLIPALPVEQRMAWLVKTESEYWESGQELQWSRLAELNGIEVDVAWSSFESARAKYMNGASGKKSPEVEPLEQLIFLVWTQANRAFKNEAYTWKYYSALLGVPENTLKTRYSYAQKQLAAGLSEFKDSGSSAE